MNWLITVFRSSIGKKLMMAITGLCFCGFLAVHLAGNLTLYGGKDSFNSYAEHLHSLGILLTIAEWGLLALALTHIITGLVLFFQNWRARPVRYQVNKNAGGRTIGSITMPYTGVLLLIFVILHLINFHFVDKTGTTIYDIVVKTFQYTPYIIIYLLAMIVAAVHVSHGFWSAFQTLGANHPKYMPMIRLIGVFFAMVVGVGFGLLPFYVSIIA